MNIEKFKSYDELTAFLKEKRIEDTKFSWKKASKLLSSWKSLMKNGCVSEEVYLKRRRMCEGISGMTDPCPSNFLRKSDKKRFCGSCGCGHRDMAVLYVDGVDFQEDKNSIRLWMPESNCPKGLHKDEKGTKTWKPIGGKIKQLAKLAKACLSEIGRFVGTEQEDAVNFTQEVIEENLDKPEEVDLVIEAMEEQELELEQELEQEENETEQEEYQEHQEEKEEQKETSR